MPATTRDFLIPILNNVPTSATQVNGVLGGLLVALIAAINPLSYFTTPYIGLVSWIIMTWWFYNINPLNMIKTSTFKGWNPTWWQTIKAAIWGLIFNPVPMFFIYAVILFIARFDAKLIA